MELSRVIKELLYSKERDSWERCKIVVSPLAHTFICQEVTHYACSIEVKTLYGRKYVVDRELKDFVIKVDYDV